MSRWRKAQALLKSAKKDAKDNPALSKTIQVVQYILDDLTAKERKESDARVALNAVRKVSVVKG